MPKEEIRSPSSIKQFFMPVLVVVAIVLAVFVGSLWQKVKDLEKGGNTAADTIQQAPKNPGIGNDKSQSGKLADFLKSVVDPTVMKSCLDSGKYDARLTSDQALATSLGIQGTPSFYINATNFPGAYSWTDMQSVSDSILQGKPLPKGTPTAGSPTVTLAQIKALWGMDLIKFGDASRKVLFVEMADPSCPFCSAADGQNHTIYQSLGPTFQLVADGGKYVSPIVEMKKLVDSGQASYVYIYYPGHGNGQMGMKALYCAQEQGKFWEVHNLIMSNDGYVLMNGS